MTTKKILEMTAEETAAWFSGESTKPWSAYITDPELRKQINDTKAAIRKVLTTARDAGISPDTPAGLRQIAKYLLAIPNAAVTTQDLAVLIQRSEQNLPISYDALRTKVAELADFAYSDA